MASEGQEAQWVEAIATVGALFVAVGAPIWAASVERRRLKREMVARTNDLIIALVGELSLLIMRVAFIAPLLSQQRNGQRVIDVDELIIRIPPRIEVLVFDRTDVDRATVEPVTRIVQAASGFNAYLEAIRRARFADAADRAGMYDHLEQQRMMVGTLIAAVVQPIQQQAGATPRE